MTQDNLGLADHMRIELTVRRVDWRLDGRVPWRKRKQIRDELRANLIEATTNVGAKAAVRQLGDLRMLGSSYLDVYRGRFDFRRGSWWAIFTYAAIQVLAIGISIGFASGVTGWSDGHAASYSFWSDFGPFGGSASSHSFELLILSPAHIALMAVAFTLGSSYRLILRR